LAQQLVQPAISVLGRRDGLITIGEADLPQPADVGIRHRDDSAPTVRPTEPRPDIPDELVQMMPVADQVVQGMISVPQVGHVGRAAAPQRAQGPGHLSGLRPEAPNHSEPVGRIAGQLLRVRAARARHRTPLPVPNMSGPPPGTERNHGHTT
jgi:hypothetical protein